MVIRDRNYSISGMSDSLWYPSDADVIAIHENVVEEYPNTDTGTRDEGCISFTIDFVRDERFNDLPNTIHGKAFHLMRLLVANHPFVDGNKRTALNTAVVFYMLNGYQLDYDERIIDILKQFGTDEGDVDTQYVHEYLREHSDQIPLEEAIDEWRDHLLRFGFDRLSEELSDPNG